jgi:flagellar hook-associated protein 1 FlgK
MSISGALASALTGLTASARGAEVVSTNIANATNETYGRRALEISAGIAGDRGTGARIDGVRRLADPVLLADRRAAGSAASGAGAEAAFFQRLEREIGLPGEAGALTDRIAGFEAALVTAASRPDSTARLADVAAAADALAERMNGLTDVLQQERMRADRAIEALSSLSTKRWSGWAI